MATTMTARATARILERLRQLPAEATTEDWWQSLGSQDWPHLFPLLGVAADLPRLESSSALASMPADLWPELARTGDDVSRLQKLVDKPIVPPDVAMARAYSLEDRQAARVELETDRCATVDFLFDAAGRRQLEAQIDALSEEKMGSWGELAQDEHPELFGLTDSALASPRFHELTGFDLDRDEYSLTLSMQDLDATGIGWHRDLYWPQEWVGEDVFAVLYGLGDDSPAKGGAFLYYVPEDNSLRAIYRQRHQATVLWNCRDNERRLLHAVSGYLGDDTSRHLIILQCLRRSA